MLETGKVLTPRALLQRVWGPEYLNEVEYVRVYVGHLRRKLESPDHPDELIETVRGVGYRFIPD
jgi:DNA-binding response OmpR family regulator